LGGWNDAIMRNGVRAIISERLGFKADRIILLETCSFKGQLEYVGFEVNGQGYVWNVRLDKFDVENAYGDRFFKL